PERIGDQRRAAVGARLAEMVQAGELAALALPVADRILDELERRVLAEVGNREHRLEDRLQARVLTFVRQPVHLQEPLIRLPPDFDQVRNRDRGLDLREVLALAIDVLGQAVHRWQILESKVGKYLQERALGPLLYDVLHRPTALELLDFDLRADLFEL